MALLSLSDWCTFEKEKVVHLPSTQSTNTDAFIAARNGALTGTWIVADQQTTGRGRSNRTWISLDGNLHASVILRHLQPLQKIPELSLVAGLALYHSVLDIMSGEQRPHVELKWPNDLLIHRKKVGGILIETSSDRLQDDVTVVIGFGLNLLSHPDVPDQQTTSLSSFSSKIKPLDFLKILDHRLYYWIAVWSEDEGLTRIRHEWTASSLPMGTPMTIKSGEGAISGLFEGINDEGYLIIRYSDHKKGIICFGDVHVDA